MRIGFVDDTPWDYSIDTPYRLPLGGSQSALCYLAESLAGAHDVWLFNRGTAQSGVPGKIRGVNVVPLAGAARDDWRQLDAVVVLNSPKLGLAIRPLLSPAAAVVLWTQHAHDQPAVQPLLRPELSAAYEALAFVSRWQQECYAERLGIAEERGRVLRNAVAPAFVGLLPSPAAILRAKCGPPVLAYTSTPYRGLDVLLEAFNRIRAAEPDARLRVYSSMQVYRQDAAADRARYGALYDRCRATPGALYIGSLPQPALAAALLGTHVLAYPNHFPETSCIAVLEALAAGCRVVTSKLGALPETTAGYGALIPVAADAAASSMAMNGPAVFGEQYVEQFVAEVLTALSRWRRDPAGQARQMAEQVAYVNAQSTWPLRAAEWSAWLRQLVDARRAASKIGASVFPLDIPA